MKNVFALFLWIYGGLLVFFAMTSKHTRDKMVLVTHFIIVVQAQTETQETLSEHQEKLFFP